MSIAEGTGHYNPPVQRIVVEGADIAAQFVAALVTTVGGWLALLGTGDSAGSICSLIRPTLPLSATAAAGSATYGDPPLDGDRLPRP